MRARSLVTTWIIWPGFSYGYPLHRRLSDPPEGAGLVLESHRVLQLLRIVPATSRLGAGYFQLSHKGLEGLMLDEMATDQASTTQQRQADHLLLWMGSEFLDWVVTPRLWSHDTRPPRAPF